MFWRKSRFLSRILHDFVVLWFFCRQIEANQRRLVSATPDWSENAVVGDHLWVPSSISGDFCYAGESDCTVSIRVRLTNSHSPNTSSAESFFCLASLRKINVAAFSQYTLKNPLVCKRHCSWRCLCTRRVNFYRRNVLWAPLGKYIQICAACIGFDWVLRL